jgi:hypothetical protein
VKSTPRAVSSLPHFFADFRHRQRETMIYPEGNITLLDAYLFDPAQLA